IYQQFGVTTPVSKVYGLNFGPYTEEGQDPTYGTVITEEQIRGLIKIIAPYTEWIKTFSCTNGLENIGRIGHEFGLKLAVGAWLNSNQTANEEQISNLISIGKAGEADMLIVGSEVLYRNDLTDDQLIEYINTVKSQVPGVPVTTADTYGELLDHSNVMDACDVILFNYYPYWEGVSVFQAVYNIRLRYQEMVAAAGNKPVIISETGWPSDGNQIGDAVPSLENASFFLLEFVTWAESHNLSYFCFEAFDEPWKANYEGPQGAHWGIWYNNGTLKLGMSKIFEWKTGLVGGPGDPSIEFTYVPPYGSYNNLIGRVYHVRPADHKVVVYIKVDGNWWIKPYQASPLTVINSDGSWTCDITTGGNDALATEIAAFLIPEEYSPPILMGAQELPSELSTFPNATVTRSP
ncbi:MAG: glycosyl hydrolase family 17 protein, partial [Candidatus Jordarchaeaceae archaeon]